MADIKGIVLKKILSSQDGHLDAWSRLKLAHFGTEYAPIYRTISKFYIKHSDLPTFEDLELHNRNPIINVSLEALKLSEEIEVDLDLAVEALLNEYTQEEVLKELDTFLDEITVLDSSEIKDELGKILLDIEEKTMSAEEIVFMNQISFEDEEALLGLMPLGLNNGFDSELGGLAPTEVMGVGGERGSGKSNICTNLMTNQYEAGNTCIYFSIEMRARELFNRELALLADVNLSRISRAACTPQEMKRIAKVRTDMFVDSQHLYDSYLEHEDYKRFERELNGTGTLKKDNQIIIVDNQNLTLANIDLTIHKYKTQFEDKLQLVVVDYLNQIAMEDKYDWKNQIKLSASLKAIARKHEIILVTPYQIDKTGEARFSKGILDSMDIAMILEREEGSGRIDFKSTKTRNKAKFSFASAVNEETMRIDPNEHNVPQKETKDEKEKPNSGGEQSGDVPW
jgi:replicative DNA helicase